MQMRLTQSTYIIGAASIAPSGVLSENGQQMQNIEPEYSDLLDPRLIRRMSKVVRTGAAAALAALRDAGIEMPDAIITGTAYGCTDDTETFLRRLIVQQEQMLAPTAFIQSTHNTIGAQIALLLKCHAYNNTIVQRAISFENALQDALLLLEDGEANNILAGAADEMSSTVLQLLKRFGLVKTGSPTSTKGAIAGEGAAYLMLSNTRTPATCARLVGVETLYQPDNPAKALQPFLKTYGLEPSDISMVLTGKNGDSRYDGIYDHFLADAFIQEKPVASFKHLCGEFPVAASFACWAAVEWFRGNNVLQTNLSDHSDPGKHILIYNHYYNVYHSFILIGSC